MGNTDTKIQYRKAVIQLTTMNQSIDMNDDTFWSQFWSDQITSIQDIYTLIPASEIRALREEAPTNLATLCVKTVERLVRCVENACITQKEQAEALNCVRLLTRILPYIFEEPEWRGFFWSTTPSKTNSNEQSENLSQSLPLAQTLLNTLSDLLFIPDFTATACKKSLADNPVDIRTLDSCEYIWESGVGFAHHPPHIPPHDYRRAEIIKLLLATFSETMYQTPSEIQPNKWIDYFTSTDNRHTLPLFTSLINVVFSYDPIGYGLPYNYIIFNDSREPLVEIVAQLLCVTLEQSVMQSFDDSVGDNLNYTIDDVSHNSNLFINYITRLHRDEDFSFILKGFCRLLNNPLIQTYLPGSAKKISFHQELLILFWKFCDFNKKFLFYVLKSSEVLDILVPILFFLIDSRADTSRIGLMHIGVFILLLLSGERNFGVRLNKPYTSRIPLDIPVFTGTHADLLIIVFHKIITTSHQRLQPLYDCLLTIIVNISPYVKSLSMVTSNKLLHLLEAFSTPTFLFSSPNNHHLVFFLLEVFNNIIQYQFDGNSNLVYTIIRKRTAFFNLLNMSIEQGVIDKAVIKQTKKNVVIDTKTKADNHMEGSIPAKEAEPGTLKATLAETPSVLTMTEKTTPATLINDQPPSSPTTEASSITATTKTSQCEDIIFNQDQSSTNNDWRTNGNTTNGNTTTNGNNVDHHITISVDKPTSPNSNAYYEKKSLHNKLQNTKKSPTSPTLIKEPVNSEWRATSEWVQSWKQKLPLQTIMRLLQVLVPQVEKICIDKGLTDESEIIKFLQHGTLVGLLPVPHPILIRKYQPNQGTSMWFKTYIWGVIYLRNVEPPIWYDTDVKLFEIQRV